MLYHDSTAYLTFKIAVVLQQNTVATGIVTQPVKVHCMIQVHHKANHLLIWVKDICEIVRAYSRYINE
jgi:hypothetical protein